MLSIGVVARQTGLEIGTLRKWESRYGFPQPLRHDSGQRYYSDRDVALLLDVVRRVSSGERVGNVIRELTDNKGISPQHHPEPSAKRGAAAGLLASAIEALTNNEALRLKALLEEALRERSMLTYVEEFAAPMTQLVGQRWASGELPVHSEHLFSMFLESQLLREASMAIGTNEPPSVLLTTPGGEMHTLGLSMVNAVLAEAGVACLKLPGSLPLLEIVAAAKAYGIKAVGLSASCHYPQKMLTSMIHELRSVLPPEIALWLGGAGMDKVCQMPEGTLAINSLAQLLAVSAPLALHRAPVLDRAGVQS